MTTSTRQAGRSSKRCPALWILRGAMGKDHKGKFVEPLCRPGYCGHCHSSNNGVGR